MSKYTDFLTPENCAVALIDYQPAMFFGVQSHDRMTIIHNARVLAKAALLFKIPNVLTSISKHNCGSWVSQLSTLFKDREIIDRTAINAWLDPNFRKAIEATGRKKIVIGALWTEACALFPALALLKEGYDVYISTDACGDVTKEAHERSVERIIQAGGTPITSLQFLFELQQDWARKETYEGVVEICQSESAYGIQVAYMNESGL